MDCLKFKLVALKISIGSVLAKLDQLCAGLGFLVFVSGLDSGYLDSGIVIIMNIILAKHVYKVSEVLGSDKINSLIVKAVSEFSFVVLDNNFNKDDSCSYTSFKKCFNLGLKNLRGVKKTIDYVFISLNLINTVVNYNIIDVSKHFNTDYWAVFISVGLDLNGVFIKESSRFHKLELLVSKIVKVFCKENVAKFVFFMNCWTSLNNIKASIIQNLVNSGMNYDHVYFALFNVRKSYHVFKLVELLRAKELGIRSAIEKQIKSFVVNKGHTIKNVLKYFFQRIMLIYLVSDGKLVLDSGKVKSKIDAIMKSWTKKKVVLDHQYLPLSYVEDNAFSEVMVFVSFVDLVCVFKNLPNKKTAGLSGIMNKFKNNFKVVTTPDATTLEYYQSIYTYCKQRFNIPDGIEVVKKSVYQYIKNRINNYLFGNYNILEVRSNFYNNLVHYSQLGTEDLNSETLATYFQELNFNIIKYCEETYPTETSNKGKQKLKQYSKTTPNTSILSKTTAKHLQTPEQRTKVPPDNKNPFKLTTVNEENDSEISEEESIDSKNKEDKMTAYIAKIPEFNGEDIKTSPQEWLDQVTKAGDANRWNAARMLKTISYFLKRTAGEWFENLTIPFNDWTVFKTAFLEQFTNNNTLITLRNCFHNIKQEPSESDKLIKKICPHAPEDLNSAIQHAKRYKMAMKEANHTKLINLSKTISPTNNNSNSKDINHPKDRIKTTLYHSLITSLRIAITVESLATRKEIAESYNKTNKTGVINVTLHHNNLITNDHYYQLTIHQDHNIKLTTINLLHSQCNNSIDNPFNITKINPNNQLVPQNSAQPRPIHYHTQPSYLTIPEKQNFHHTALSKGRAAARQQNPSYTLITIPPARIAENANLSDIFPFEFEANELPFLLSNAAANKQKAITAMYIEAEVEGKAICLILNIIVTADGMKKIPVEKIDNFLFTLDRITILVKYQAFIGNDWLQKANAKLDWKTQELQLSYQGQYAQVSVTCEKAPVFEFEEEKEKPVVETFMALESTSNWAEETEQTYFATNSYPEEPETSG
ncbi:hypothetical protein G9A89_014025 [Geosiphon pyriformis]|nr:hypothetical protein G9A89_014025 [Geosiphon pyriformis]